MRDRLEDESTDPVLIRQMQFYAATANSYDAWHVDAHDEHFAALNHAVEVLRSRSVESVLDVGCGTGRALLYLSSHLPGVRFRGIDPSRELLRIAVERNGVPADWVELGDGYAIRYGTGSFDAVIATGVLHHVQKPAQIVNEMVRVSRRVVLVSDMNTYGMGKLPYRLIKVLARSVRLIRHLHWLRYGGHNWFYSADDGVAFPYSVYDTAPWVRRHASAVSILPTAGGKRMNQMPLLCATHALLVAYQD